MASGSTPVPRDKARVSGHLGSAASWSPGEVKRPSNGETLRDSWLRLTDEVPGGESKDGEDMLLGRCATKVSNNEHGGVTVTWTGLTEVPGGKGGGMLRLDTPARDTPRPCGSVT